MKPSGLERNRAGEPARRQPVDRVLVVVLLLTLGGGLVRAAGLPDLEGTLGRDETRLALAARGILEHGYPVLPGGLVYTRGLLPAYLEAAGLALVGASDRAVVWPSIAFGTALVPAIYLLARGWSGQATATFAGGLTAFSTPLIHYSREAWFYSGFVFWFVLAIHWLRQAELSGRARTRFFAALAGAAALFSHELAILLVPIAVLADLRRWRRQRTEGNARGAASTDTNLTPRQWLAFWPMILVATLVAVGLTLLLRSPSAGGASSEFRDFLRPGIDPHRLMDRVKVLAGWQSWLLPFAVVGAMLPRLRRFSFGLLGITLVVLGVFDGFVLVDRDEPRYVLMLTPFVIVAGAVGLADSARAAWEGLGRKGPGRGAATILALVAVLVVAGRSASKIAAEIVARNEPAEWLRGLSGRSTDDLVLSYSTTVTTYYLGRTDFWLRSRQYEKYVWNGPPPYVDVHTGALTIRDLSELERLVISPNRGRVLWAVLDADQAAGRPAALREVVATLGGMASAQYRATDGRVVWRVRL